MVTKAEIEAGKTHRGGYTREQLAKWGVPWPPPRGWKQKLLEQKKIYQLVDRDWKTKLEMRSKGREMFHGDEQARLAAGQHIRDALRRVNKSGLNDPRRQSMADTFNAPWYKSNEDRIERLEQENKRLRARIEELQGPQGLKEHAVANWLRDRGWYCRLDGDIKPRSPKPPNQKGVSLPIEN